MPGCWTTRIAIRDPSLEERRQNYRTNDARLKLQKYLEERIADPHIQYASWFVNDLRGMQIASVFKETPDTNTLGRNYSYRTYFTGLDKDLSHQSGDETIYDVAPAGVERPIIRRPPPVDGFPE